MNETAIGHDLGHDHFLRYFSWAPEDLPGNRQLYGTQLPNVEKAGVIIRHQRPNGDWCESAIHFDLRELMLMRNEGHVWQVISWEPLTLSPSLLCRLCGDHGFIRDGRWVPA